MRTVDLVIYADMLAGEAATVGARLERARSKIHLAAIESAARADLPGETVIRLQALGFLATRADRGELHEQERALAAIEELQAWVDSRLSPSAA